VTVSRFLPASLALASLLVPSSWAADGAEIFAAHCASCHGLDGKARTPAGKKFNARDLSESKLTDAEIAHQILEGVKDTKGAPRMPAFKEKVAPSDVAALVTHVKTFRR
jgi:mono/diheme cytochrome c family protein